MGGRGALAQAAGSAPHLSGSSADRPLALLLGYR